jgi:NAD(P)-dependent dehydrogenase (short-subunit alcohol dehydrogenase family)
VTGRLDGKVAIVTGSGTKLPGIGIGCAIAQTLTRDGAAVLIADFNEENANATLRMIEEEGGRAAVSLTDVAKEDDCAAMVRTAVDTFGGIDILVNNAGISIHEPVTETTQALFDRIIGVNLRGAFMCCKYAVPELIARGGGSIVNIGSIAALRDTGSSHPAYAASKGGVHSMTIDIAGEYGRDNVRVNAVLPGMIQSPIQESVGNGPIPEDVKRRMNMLGRMGTVWDIANAVWLLCLPEASYITGHILPIDGGATVALPPTWTRPDRPGKR